MKKYNLQMCVWLLLLLLAVPKLNVFAYGPYILPQNDKTGYPVTGIGEQYEKGNNSIKELIVPDNIKRIGEEAFMDCENIETMIFTGNLEHIGARAFDNTAYYNDITNWDNGVLYIGEYLIRMKPEAMIHDYTVRPGTRLIAAGAFEGCTALEKITIPESVEFVGEDAFSRTLLCKTENWDNGVLYVENILVDINEENVPEVVEVREGTRVIADGAFRGCNTIREVVCTVDSLLRIGQDAFESCGNMSSIQIGANVQSMGYGPFRLCEKLQEISVDEQNEYFAVKQHVLYDKELSTVIRCATMKTGTVTLPESVVLISAYSFEGCSLLSEVIIPDGTLFIGQRAFSLCHNLKDMTLPESVEYISSFAFEECNSLVNMVIPDAVYYLGGNAFTGCDKLESIKIGEGINSVKSSTFANCTALKSVEMGSAVTEIAQDAFVDTKLVTDYANYQNGCLIISDKYLIKVQDDLDVCEIPNGVRTIASGAILDADGECVTKKIKVPASVCDIGGCNFELVSDAKVKVSFEGTRDAWMSMTYANRRYNLTTKDDIKQILEFFIILSALMAVTIGLIIYNVVRKSKVQKLTGSNSENNRRIVWATAALILFVLYIGVYIYTQYITSYDWMLSKAMMLKDLICLLPYAALFLFSICSRALKHVNPRIYLSIILLLFGIQYLCVDMGSQNYWLKFVFNIKFVLFDLEFKLIWLVYASAWMMMIFVLIIEQDIMKAYCAIMIYAHCIEMGAVVMFALWGQSENLNILLGGAAGAVCHYALYQFSGVMTADNRLGKWSDKLISRWISHVMETEDDFEEEWLEEDIFNENYQPAVQSVICDDREKLMLYALCRNDEKTIVAFHVLEDLSNLRFLNAEGKVYKKECILRHLLVLRDAVKKVNTTQAGYCSEEFVYRIEELIQNREHSTWMAMIVNFAEQIFGVTEKSLHVEKWADEII